MRRSWSRTPLGGVGVEPGGGRGSHVERKEQDKSHLVVGIFSHLEDNC